MELIKTMIRNHRSEMLRRKKISQALRNHYAIKRAEKGLHRVYVNQYGECLGYFLLQNLY